MAGQSIKISILADVADAVKSVTKFSDVVDTETKRVVTGLGDSKMTGGFGKMQEGFDVADTRAMGFRDTITGVQDSMTGWQMVTGESQKVVDDLNTKVATATTTHDALKKKLEGLQTALGEVNKKKDPEGYAKLQTQISETKTQIDASGESLKGLQGDLSTAEQKTGTFADGLLRLGTGVGDLASGFANFIVPMAAVTTSITAGGLASARATVSSVAHKVAMAASAVVTGTMTAAQWLLNAALSANPIGIVVLAIVALIAIFVLAYQNCDTFREIVDKAWEGIKTAVSTVVTWFTTNVPKIWTAAKDAFGKIPKKVSEVVADVKKFVGELPGKIKALFSKAGDWLLQAGKDIINGLWDGLKAVWDSVTRWFSDITSKIPNLKGPASRDAKLLRKNGQLVIGGFLHGLESRYGDVKDSLAGFTNDLSGSATGSLDLTATGSSSGSGSAGPAVVVNLDMKFGEREFGRLMVDALRKEVRARGGITAVFA